MKRKAIALLLSFTMLSLSTTAYAADTVQNTSSIHGRILDCSQKFDYNFLQRERNSCYGGNANEKENFDNSSCHGNAGWQHNVCECSTKEHG